MTRQRQYRAVRAIAAVVAVGTLVGVPAAIIHDGVVVKTDVECRGKQWNDLTARLREGNRDAIARACTPELISALSSRLAKSPTESACESLYYHQTTDAENAAILSSCHLTERPVPTGGFMYQSTRAWRACAAATPGPEVCARDAWLLVLGAGAVILVVGTSGRFFRDNDEP